MREIAGEVHPKRILNVAVFGLEVKIEMGKIQGAVQVYQKGKIVEVVHSNHEGKQKIKINEIKLSLLPKN